MLEAGYQHHSRRPLSDVELSRACELPLGLECTDSDSGT